MQEGGGDLDSVIEMANKTDLLSEMSMQEGGDLDSVLDLANQVNLESDIKNNDTDSLMELGKIAKMI